jgi:hypothetical protein
LFGESASDRKREEHSRKERGNWRLPDRRGDRRWQQWQLDLLSTSPDAGLAARFGRTVTAVRVMRNCLGRRPPAGDSKAPHARAASS